MYFMKLYMLNMRSTCKVCRFVESWIKIKECASDCFVFELQLTIRLNLLLYVFVFTGSTIYPSFIDRTRIHWRWCRRFVNDKIYKKSQAHLLFSFKPVIILAPLGSRGQDIPAPISSPPPSSLLQLIGKNWQPIFSAPPCFKYLIQSLAGFPPLSHSSSWLEPRRTRHWHSVQRLLEP